jgi:lantibiotic biosynthesis protein
MVLAHRESDAQACAGASNGRDTRSTHPISGVAWAHTILRSGSSAPARQHSASPRPVGAGLHLPGSQWLSLALRAPAHLHDQLAMSLEEAVESPPQAITRWFWLRYADTTAGPHLRARSDGDPAVPGGQVLPALSAWCQRAIQKQLCSGFIIQPYDQEIELYGGTQAISAAEDVFAADSRLALAILRAVPDLDQRMIAAAHCAATTALAVATTALAVATAHPAEAIGRRRLDRAARHRTWILVKREDLRVRRQGLEPRTRGLRVSSFIRFVYRH